MGWTLPRDWTAGEIVTAAIMNTHVRDDLRYLKGLDGDTVFSDDIDVAGNKYKTTNYLIKEEAGAGLHIRNIADNADAYIRTAGLRPSVGITPQADAISYNAGNVDNYYATFGARRNTTGISEIARLFGGVQPRLKHTLPLNIGADSELTLDTNGIITVGVASGAASYNVDTFEDAASDSLVTINGGLEGDIIVLHPNNGARTVIVDHMAGNIACQSNADFTMDDDEDYIVLQFDGTNWQELSRKAETGTTTGDPGLVGINQPVVQSTIISFTRNTSVATGDVAYTGAGFIPTAIIFIAAVGANLYASIGFADDAIGETCINTDQTSGNWAIGAYAIYYSNGADVHSAVVKTLDADGFTLTWTKTNTPTATLTCRALCMR